jgi:hypothetical protein
LVLASDAPRELAILDPREDIDWLRPPLLLWDEDRFVAYLDAYMAGAL